VTGQRGGVANEAGSAHRLGAAAVLAAHGLAGRGITGDATTAFETDQATADLACRAAHGSTMYISAKRTCGNDQENLGGTVVQWVAQSPTLAPGDLLVLATAELKRQPQRGCPAPWPASGRRRALLCRRPSARRWPRSPAGSPASTCRQRC
jgi:hypothetical protein